MVNAELKVNYGDKEMIFKIYGLTNLEIIQGFDFSRTEFELDHGNLKMIMPDSELVQSPGSISFKFDDLEYNIE